MYSERECHIDHIVPEADGGSHDPANLQILCAPAKGKGCHRVKTRIEAKKRARARGGADPWSIVAGAGFVGVGGLGAYGLATGAPIAGLMQDAALYVGVGAALGLAATHLLPPRQMAIRESLSEDTAVLPVTGSGDLADRALAALAPLMGEIDVSATTIGDGRKGVVVAYGSDVSDHSEAERLKVQERANMKLGGRWELFWNGTRNELTIVPRPTLPRMIRHPGLPDARKWHEIPIGPRATIDLSVTAHVLITGTTGSGKTSVMRSIVLAAIDSAKRGEAEVILADPKRCELIGFRGWPGVRGVMTDDDSLWDMPIRLRKEMEERYRKSEEEGVQLGSFTPIIAVIDEYREFAARMRGMYAMNDPVTGKPRRITGQSEPTPLLAVGSLLSMARMCGIHLIIGTQRADAKIVGGDSRDNIQGRVGVGPLNKDAALMLFDRSDYGRDLPADAKGRITFQQGDGGFIEDQSYWVPDPGDAKGTNAEEDWEHLERLKA